MKLILLFLLVSFSLGLLVHEKQLRNGHWLAATLTVVVTALYFVFTADFI